MAKLIRKAAVIKTEGTPVEEIVGRLSSKTADISMARMHSRRGWVDHEQKRQFAEYILVFKGALYVKTRRQSLVARAGQAVAIRAGEWVQYSTPEAGGARYLAVCVPAYHPDQVERASAPPAPRFPRRPRAPHTKAKLTAV